MSSCITLTGHRRSLLYWWPTPPVSRCCSSGRGCSATSSPSLSWPSPTSMGRLRHTWNAGFRRQQRQWGTASPRRRCSTSRWRSAIRGRRDQGGCVPRPVPLLVDCPGVLPGPNTGRHVQHLPGHEKDDCRGDRHEPCARQ